MKIKKIGTRLNKLMIHLNVNHDSFAESIGVSSLTLSNVIGTNEIPSSEFLDKILRVYPNINKDWLLDDIGDMLQNQDSEFSEFKDGIGTRIEELMFYLRKNQSTFGDEIGVSQTSVRNIIRSIYKPKYEFIESILKTYPNVNKEWLIDGVGEMFNDDSLASSNIKDGIGSRINTLIFFLKKNQSTFGKSIGVSHTSVRNVINGVYSPKHEFIQRILKVYSNVNPNWLVSGEGEMFKSEEKPSPTPEKGNDYLMDDLSKIEKSFMKDLDEKNRMIDDQRFIIETLKKQIEILMQGQGANFQDPKIEEPFVYPVAA